MAAVAALAGLWAGSVPAFALTQRGHVAIGPLQHEGKCELSNPGGVAVNESTGEIYVVDREHEVVDRLSATGACLSQFKVNSPEGIAVDNSSSPSAGDVYVVSAIEKASEERTIVSKFDSEGKPIAKLKEAKEGSAGEEFGAIHGVSVDSKGRLWVDQGEQVDGFNGGAPLNGFVGKTEIASECELTSGFAVGPQAEVLYVNHFAFRAAACSEAVVVTGKRDGSGNVLVEQLDSERSSGVAADVASSASSPLGEPARSDVYVDNESTVASFSSSGVLVQRFGSGKLVHGRGVAIDSANGNVYVAEPNRVAVFGPESPAAPTVDSLTSQNFSPTSTELKAQIDAHGADTHYYFQYGTESCEANPSSCSDAPATCVECVPPVVTPPGPDLGSAFGSRAVGVVLANLRPGTTYFVRVVATNEHGEGTSAGIVNTFTTLPAPEGVLLDHRAWEMVSPSEKDGSGIEPIGLEGGPVQASEDGTALSYEANGPVVDEPEGNRSFEPTQVLSARGEKQWISQDIAPPVQRAEGIEVGEPSDYRVFSPNLSLGLLQPRGFKNQILEEPPLAPGAKEKTLYLRSDPPLQPISTNAEEVTHYVEAERNGEAEHPEIKHPAGYLPVVTAGNVLNKETKLGGHLDFATATPDLSHVLVESSETNPLTPEAKSSEFGLYEWSGGGGGSLRLASVMPGPKAEPAPCETGSCPNLGAYSVNVRHALSDDGSRVIFSNQAFNRLFLRDLTPGHEETILLNRPLNGESEEEEDEAESGQVGFETASSDGSRVFFTSTKRLTSNSTLEPVPGIEEKPADLYVCEVIREENGKLHCKLTDLSAENGISEAGTVLNLIPGASKDGSVVYFVANGALVPGAAPGGCVTGQHHPAPAGATCNLYMRRYAGELGKGKWEPAKLIAVLSNDDSGDWGAFLGPGQTFGEEDVNKPDLADLTTSVSQSGQFLAFMSDRPLTGYNNAEVHSGAPAQEVFLYDANEERLVCVSCKSDGAPPTGVFDTLHAGEGEGLLVDRRQDWLGQWLAGSIPGWTTSGKDHAYYQPRYLSDKGRLFFNSADALVPQVEKHMRVEEIAGQKVTVGVERVYEYEPQGEGTCTSESGCVALISGPEAEHESTFLDASVSGNDAFFTTAQPLVAQDHDTNYDAYDARVCANPSECFKSEASTQPPCEEVEKCRPGAAASPAFGAPASSMSSASGNATPKNEVLGTKKAEPTQAQRLARALSACRHKYKAKSQKKKRAACEAQARKRHKVKKPAKKAAKKAARRPSRRRR